MSIMSMEQRALQFWAVLALCATHRQVITYHTLHRLTGEASPGIGAVLEKLQRYCLAKSLPPLTVLVVQEGTGLPGPGFTAETDIPLAQTKVFGFDWIVRGYPDVSELS